MAKVARVMAKVARVMATKAMLLINFILTVGKIRRGSEGLFGVWCWEMEEYERAIAFYRTAIRTDARHYNAW